MKPRINYGKVALMATPPMRFTSWYGDTSTRRNWRT